MRLLVVFVFLLGLVSCGEEKSSSSGSSISSSDNYVFLKIKEGDDILVESDKANWFEDGVKGTTSNGYPKDEFNLKIFDLEEKIAASYSIDSICGAEFDILISYKKQDYEAIAIIEKTSKSENTQKFIGTEYFLIGKIKSFDMGDKQVSEGNFSFSTFLK